jgi:hypothetical protein
VIYETHTENNKVEGEGKVFKKPQPNRLLRYGQAGGTNGAYGYGVGGRAFANLSHSKNQGSLIHAFILCVTESILKAKGWTLKRAASCERS